ncbi:predicted protein [Chaetoceros tenuissimus]|uniref:Uncharacterized protein n=1 Tax=Chaetoceros tenuissimus TaxID=426638 RepID=A0AAD3HEW2_9STRA|nr:predicted protein [Chaetoceros tenuissimus]
MDPDPSSPEEILKRLKKARSIPNGGEYEAEVDVLREVVKYVTDRNIPKFDPGVPLSKDELVGKGTEKLFEIIFNETAPAGFGGMMWAHIDAPMKALEGNGKDAVDSAVGGVGALAGGVIGGPIGALVGYAITKGPGKVIDVFDTSTAKFKVTITNLTKYNVYLDGYEKKGGWRYSSPGVYQNAWFPDGGGGMYNRTGFLIPKVVTGTKDVNHKTVEALSFSYPMPVNDTSFSFSMRFIAREGKMYHTCKSHEEKKDWFDDRSAIKHSWSFGIQAPGTFAWTYYASIDSKPKDTAKGHEEAYNEMEVQSNFGKPGHLKDGQSCCYWEDKNTVVIQLADD